MVILPTDVVSIIFDYLPPSKYNNLKQVDKYYNKEYNKKILFQIIKIQKFYKKNRVWYSYGADLPYFMGYNLYCRFLNLLKRNMYYRKIILWTNDEYFKRLPEQILSRLPLRSSRYIILRDWISNNLETDAENRKRSDIVKFLKYNRIKIRECMRAGI